MKIDLSKYGIEKLVGNLTIEDLKKEFSWVLDANIKNAIIDIVEIEDVITKKKKRCLVWENGTWVSGIWENGFWENGTWNGGTWKNGTWENGTWNGGTWIKGTWIKGTWNDGTFKGGTWEKGTWNGGEFKGGIWESGKYLNGKGSPYDNMTEEEWENFDELADFHF